jgi:hypothetical protein
MFDFLSKAFRSMSPKEELDYSSFPGFLSEQDSDIGAVSESRSNWFEDEITKGGYTVKIKKGLKQMTIFRFLLAKLVYEENGLHLDEFLVLFHLYYNLSEIDDPSFKEKYDNWFFRHTYFFSYLAEAQNFPVRLKVDELREDLIKNLGPVIPTKHSYYGLKGQRGLRQSFEVRLNSSLPVQRIKPKNFIGVGYRDKGTRRDLAKNGNPSWQEVSAHNFELERRAEEFLDQDKSAAEERE